MTTDFTIYDTLKADHETAQSGVTALETQVQTLVTQVSALDAQISSLQVQGAKDSAQIMALISERDQLATQVQTSLTEITRLNAEIARLTQTTPPNPPNPPTPTTGYKLYPGAEQPATTYKRTLYVDPVNGLDTGDGSQAKPFRSIKKDSVSWKKLMPGDHVIFLPGVHDGTTFYGPYGSPLFKDATEWTWFDFKPGAKIPLIALRQVKRFLITNPEFVPVGSAGAVEFTGTEQVVMFGAKLNGMPSKDADQLTIAEWMALPSIGGTRNAKYVSITGSKIKNVRGGFSIGWDQVPGKAPQNSSYALIEDNEIDGNSADFMRACASDVIYRKNRFTRGYAPGPADGNHDDGFQGFAYPAPTMMKDAAGVVTQPVTIDPSVPYAEYSNILLEENVFMDKLKDGQPNASGYQGFNIFDGVYSNVTVRKNIIMGGAYHGLSLYGVQGAVIENNIVLSTSPVGSATRNKYWVATPNSKPGLLSKNVTVRNNIGNQFNPTANWVVNTNNQVMKSEDAAQHFVAFDTVNGVYDFHIKPTSPLFGKGLGIY